MVDVWKIGGSCLSGAESYRRAVGRLQARGLPRVLVISAMAGVTDALENTVRGDREAVAILLQRHRQTWVDLGGDEGAFELWALNLHRAVSDRHLPPGQASILAWGDEMSAALMDCALRDAGCSMELMEPGDLGLVLRDPASPPDEALPGLVQGLSRHGGALLVPGFVALDHEGQRITLGRNTGDLSGALFAAAAGAETFHVLSRVGGIMTADPDLVSGAGILADLDYSEALEMVHGGAPVLHPRAIELARRHDIPIVLESLEDSDKRGTRISSACAPGGLSAVTFRDGLQLATLYPGATDEGAGILRVTLELLDKKGVHVEMAAASDSCVMIAVDASLDLHGLLQKSAGDFGLECRRCLASVSLVGRVLVDQPDARLRALSALGRAGIHPVMTSQTGVSPGLTCLVETRDLPAAVNSLHEAFGLPS